MAQFVVTRGGRDAFVDLAGLESLAQRGQLAPGDLVYHPTLGRWLYAREVEEVRHAVAAAAALGRAAPAGVDATPGPSAIAGLLCGLLGHLPLVGLVFCLCGVFFSSRALGSGRDRGLASAGLVLSLVFLVPASACAATLLSGYLR